MSLMWAFFSAMGCLSSRPHKSLSGAGSLGWWKCHPRRGQVGRGSSQGPRVVGQEIWHRVFGEAAIYSVALVDAGWAGRGGAWMPRVFVEFARTVSASFDTNAQVLDVSVTLTFDTSYWDVDILVHVYQEVVMILEKYISKL